jgi:uncharacterized membrane protein YhaH (DUF805 family)
LVFFEYEGRLNRLPYFGYGLALTLVTGVLQLISQNSNPNFWLGFIFLHVLDIVVWIIVFMSLFLTAKRLHDLDISSKWLVVFLIPFFGISFGYNMFGTSPGQVMGIFLIIFGFFFFVMNLYLLIIRGTVGENRYGLGPLAPQKKTD